MSSAFRNLYERFCTCNEFTENKDVACSGPAFDTFLSSLHKNTFLIIALRVALSSYIDILNSYESTHFDGLPLRDEFGFILIEHDQNDVLCTLAALVQTDLCGDGDGMKFYAHLCGSVGIAHKLASRLECIQLKTTLSKAIQKSVWLNCKRRNVFSASQEKVIQNNFLTKDSAVVFQVNAELNIMNTKPCASIVAFNLSQELLHFSFKNASADERTVARSVALSLLYEPRFVRDACANYGRHEFLKA